jgi:hypothetical protein
MKAEEKGETACNPEAQVEAFEEPLAVYGTASSVDPEAEALARAEAGALVREQADAEVKAEEQESARLMSEAGIGAPELTAIRIERPKELKGATWQIPFDGKNLCVTVNHDGKITGSVCDWTDQWRRGLPRRCCAAVSKQPR